MQLAVKGGSPIKEQVGEYSHWPVGTFKEKEALKRVLCSGKWGLAGKETQQFINKYKDYCRVDYGLTVSSGTIALELIMRALEIGQGDEVIVPAYTFVASVSAVIMCGAVPVFADIDPETFLIHTDDARKKVTSRTRAILGVHLGGSTFDIDRLLEICKINHIVLIEDAAQAHGSAWRGKPAGSWGKAAGFSFQASKNLSCGEGGFAATNDQLLYERIWSIWNNGRQYGDMGYGHPFVGTNARITEWQAAILNAKLEGLDAQIDLRMENAAYLSRQLEQFNFLKPLKCHPGNSRNSYHLYMMRYHKERLSGISREKFIMALNAERVCHASEGYTRPIYDMELMNADAYRKNTGTRFIKPVEPLPGTELITRQEGMWINHSSLLGSREDMDLIIEALAKIAKYKDELL